MRRELAGTLAVVILMVGGVSFALAAPPTITDTFDSSNDGWEVYEGAAEAPADWVATGGNPGGFIRYSDADASGSGAVFVDEDYVTDIARYAGDPIVVDLRANGPRDTGPTVYLGDAEDLDAPMIHLTRDGDLSTSWQHYEFPLRSNLSHKWRDENGDPVSQADFLDFLDTDPAILFRADYSSAAGETTDLDTVGIITLSSRELSLKYSHRKKAFSGRVTSMDDPACQPNVPVTLFRVNDGKRKKVGAATTGSTGRYKISDPGKAGKYFSRVKRTDLPPPSDPCAPAKSKKVKLK